MQCIGIIERSRHLLNCVNDSRDTDIRTSYSFPVSPHLQLSTPNIKICTITTISPISHRSLAVRDYVLHADMLSSFAGILLDRQRAACAQMGWVKPFADTIS